MPTLKKLFETPACTRNWQAINDGVMGGASVSRLRFDSAGYAVFEGEVSLINNGGFASVRALGLDLGCSDTVAYVLTVCGDGRTYKLNLRTEAGFDGMTYQAAFTPARGRWTQAVLPLAEFEPRFRGRLVPDAPALRPEAVTQVGLLISDKQAGVFRLMVKAIGVVPTLTSAAGPTQMAAPLLFTYRRCPYAMRARMALLVAGIAFDGFEIVLRDKPAALLALSTKATVPVLQLPEGWVLEESWDIVQWALASQDPHGWWSRAQSAENLALLACNDGLFKHHLDRYKYPERHSVPDRNGHREQALAALLLPLENRLQHKPYLGGVSPCATDIALFPFVRQFSAVEPVWFLEQPLPALRAWLKHWLTSPLFESCMVKLPSQIATAFPPLEEAIDG